MFGGGCGACTIVLGELVDNKIVYKASTVNGFAKEIVDPLINF